jgi:hypothetical protein
LSRIYTCGINKKKEEKDDEDDGDKEDEREREKTKCILHINILSCNLNIISGWCVFVCGASVLLENK